MTPWAPTPLWLAYDLRVRPLSWAERGVLHHLYLLAGASPDGATVRLDARVGEAVTATWERALGKDGAAHVGRIVELGLLATCPEGLRATMPARELQGTARGGEGARTGDGPSETGKPSESPASARARNDASLFGRRTKQWAGVAPGVTWSAWLATPEGVEHLARREITHPGYGSRVTRVTGVTQEGYTHGLHPGLHPGYTPLSPLSHSPLSPGKEEKNEREETREGYTPGSHGSHPKGYAPKVTPLDALRDAAGGNATLTGSTDLERELLARLARMAVTADEARAMGAAFASLTWWPKGKHPAPAHPMLSDLAGYRDPENGCAWRALDALVAHARAKRPKTSPTPSQPVRAAVSRPPVIAPPSESSARILADLLRDRAERAAHEKLG